jgi:FkbM family methyltransferase
MKLTPRQIIHAFVWVKRHLLSQYRVEPMSTIQRFLTPTDVCIDVGAHAGSWTLPLSKLVSKGHVYAFEALPYYSEVLKMTIRLLRRKNITVFNNAIVDNNRSVNIVWKDNKGNRLTGKTHVIGLEESAESVVVEGITLDTFLERISTTVGKIRFIKMDIEGAELLALKGATKLINVHRPVFYLEIYDSYCQRYGYSAEKIFNFLGNYKYASFIIQFTSNYKLISIDSSSYSGEGDVLFVPREELSILDI